MVSAVVSADHCSCPLVCCSCSLGSARAAVGETDISISVGEASASETAVLRIGLDHSHG